MTTAALRRRAGQRVSAAVWALLVIGAGILSIAAYSGYEIDLELAAIILLAAVGGWLLFSAAVSGICRKREIRAATAPTVEEGVEQPVEDRDSTDEDSPGRAASLGDHEAPARGTAADVDDASATGDGTEDGDGDDSDTTRSS